MNYPRYLSLFSLVFCLLLVAACSNVKTEAKYPTRGEGDGDIVYQGERESIFGEGGIKGLLKGQKDDEDNTAGGAGIGVNSFLWRAALDTVSFMPISSADPFGGTIITDWHQPGDVKNERLKINIFILSEQLRADGIRASIFKQQKNEKDEWIDSSVSKETVRQFEDTILTRARQLRVAQVGR